MPFAPIETERLILRQVTHDDHDAWYAMFSDPETMQHYPAPFTADKVRSWIVRNLDNYARYGFGLWAVVLKETGEVIGDCGLTMQNIYGDGRLFPEVGFHIRKDHWRKGYAKEAAAAALRYAFENTNCPEIFCSQKYTNIASQKTAESLGLTFRKSYPDEKNGATTVYSITREEYFHK